MSERELIKRAQAGDFEAFTALINNEKEKIYRLALKLTGNRSDAEDILQDTMLKAVEKIDTFRLESSFGTWLYIIALNNIRRVMGTKKQAVLKPMDDYLPDGHGATGELLDWGDPHSILEREEIKNIIDTALAKMPQTYSAPFVLRYIEELSVKEIAETLRLSEAATKSRILRARLSLRETISEKMKEKISERV
jgi:RNA polymerase sigma-70 factor (ECF subfamily)